MNTLYVIATYEVRQEYGGPEEGGWWYSDGPLVELHGSRYTEQDANTTAWEMNRLHRESGSWDGYGGLVTTVVEIPRRVPTVPTCHTDVDQIEYETRLDVPRYYRDDQPAPHYC
jgi:hypothetical protein